MKSDDDDFSLLVFLLVAFAMGCFVGGCSSCQIWRADAIEQGFAEYNQTTGKWQWKEPKQ